MSATKDHPYHIVDPSIWPLLGAIAAFSSVLGIILWARDFGPWVLIGGLGFLVYVLNGWWRDVTSESITPGMHSKVVKIGFRYGMVLFIMSEVMFFFAFFWAYFDAALDPKESIGFVWPPEGLKTFDPYEVPLLNTVILLLSGTTITWAHHLLIEGDNKGAAEKTAYTVALGIIFTACQAFEYMHASFSLDDNVYTSTFFIATGFHGAHVIIGTTFLAVCYKRLRKGHFSSDDHFGFEAAAWYWHFVDVVWIFLFFSIYIWGSGTNI